MSIDEPKIQIAFLGGPLCGATGAYSATVKETGVAILSGCYLATHNTDHAGLHVFKFHHWPTNQPDNPLP